MEIEVRLISEGREDVVFDYSDLASAFERVRNLAESTRDLDDGVERYIGLVFQIDPRHPEPGESNDA